MADNFTSAHTSGAPREKANRQKLRMQMILLSFSISVVLMGLKFLTFYLTHSSAVLSDALESIINVVASAFATISVWMSAKPPDHDHPYGHGKIEYFSAGFEGALIICAAIGIFYTGIKHILMPHDLPHLEQGLAILLLATVVNLFLGIALLKVGRNTDSVTLLADGKHIITDVYTSGAVVIGLALVHWTGWLWLDGMVACLVGINILVAGGNLVRLSFARLMDASDSQLLDRIAVILESQRRKEWIDIHQLRAWQAGKLIHIDLHIVLPKDLSMEQAHCQAAAVEELLTTQYDGNASVLVHIDPCDPRLCPVCRQNRCQWRTKSSGPRIAWDRHHLIRSLKKR
ncbi:MAG: cation diffusion facilitator family transporter [Desulfobacteraceae bacterium]|jgi:cation diffusion facilitator family transporter